jgi:hypothetical protein
MNCLVTDCFWKPELPDTISTACSLKNVYIMGNESDFKTAYTLTALCTGTRHVTAPFKYGNNFVWCLLNVRNGTYKQRR